MHIYMHNTNCSLVDNLIARHLSCQCFDWMHASVLLRARVRLSRRTSQFYRLFVVLGSHMLIGIYDYKEPISCKVPQLSFTLTLRRTGASSQNVGKRHQWLTRCTSERLINSDTATGHLWGLVAIVEDWHTTVTVIYDRHWPSCTQNHDYTH